MQYKIKTLKNINLMKKAIFTIAFMSVVMVQAQMNKIDGVEVVIGKNIVLDSDIEKFKLDLQTRTEGKIDISDCEMLEQLMLQKLLAHHAIIDSVLVTTEQVNATVNRNIAYFTQQFGSIEKVISTYGFNDIEDLKKEIFKVEKENALVQQEQEKINEKIDVTPEEVRIYFNGLKAKNELPEFQAEIEMAQIVLYAQPTQEEINRVIAKLNELKKEIEGGNSFRMAAILNSEDTGVVQNGGRYPVTQDDPRLIKEFKEMAFTLDIGQISEPFKSDYGYHIMQLEEIKGRERIVSHILIKPNIPESTLKEIENKVLDIRNEILSKEITFEEAVKKYSEDKDTKFNQGIIVNAQTNETKFDLTRMDPSLYARIGDLQKGEITDPFYDETEGGEKMFKIIIMKDRTNTHTADLVEDYVKIQKLALQKKKEENITKWAKNIINDTYIKISDKYKKCTFEKNWKKEIN